MTYKVIIHPEAEEAYRYIAERAPVNALTWYNGLLDAMFSLEDFPKRFPLARKAGSSNMTSAISCMGIIEFYMKCMNVRR